MNTMMKPLFASSSWGKRWQGTAASCGAITCTVPQTLWRRVWRRRSTLLDGVHYCSPQCLETALLARLSRLMAIRPSPPPRNRMPLGLLMVARGKLTYTEVLAALEAQRRARYGKIGEWFEKLGFATEQEITSALGLQWGCPVASSLDSEPPASLPRIPFSLLEAFHMLPLRYVASTKMLHLAFCQRVDHSVLYAIEKMLDCRTQPSVAAHRGIQSRLERLQQQHRPSEVEFERVRDTGEIARISANYIHRFGADEVRLDRLGPYLWFRMMARGVNLHLLFRIEGKGQALTASA